MLGQRVSGAMTDFSNPNIFLIGIFDEDDRECSQRCPGKLRTIGDRLGCSCTLSQACEIRAQTTRPPSNE
jgi:hypothetical protein